MSQPPREDPDDAPAHRHPTDDEPENQPLHRLLREFAGVMAEIRDGSPACLSEGIARWEDADFVYFEVEMPELESGGIDLCLNEGRLYARIAR